MKEYMNMKNEWDDNMDVLELLSKNLKDIQFTKRIHPGLFLDSKTTTIEGINGDPIALYNWMMNEFGHCIMGKWQFLYEKKEKTISCIKSGASFGMYEIYSDFMDDPERFNSAKECLKRIKELLL